MTINVRITIDFLVLHVSSADATRDNSKSRARPCDGAKKFRAESSCIEHTILAKLTKRINRTYMYTAVVRLTSSLSRGNNLDVTAMFP